MKPLYLQFAPSPATATYLDSIWVQESAAVPLAPPTTILPNGRIELIVNYGDRFSQIDGGHACPLPAAHVVGQQHRPVYVRAEGVTRMIIARFKPWAAAICFPLPLAELIDDIVALDSVWPHSFVEALLADVMEAGTPERRARIVERFIATNSDAGKLDYAAAAAMDTLNREWGTSRVATLAAQLGLSRRQFGRRFMAAVGTTPKKMSCMLRAQKAVTCLQNDWAAQDIVASCAYADQSHLIHDVVAHTGVNPSALRRHKGNGLQAHYNSNCVDAICGQTYL